MTRLVRSGFSAGACSQGLMAFLNQQTMIILIACVAILWWTTDYTTCDPEDSKANPLPHDSLVQDSIGKETEGHQDEETYTSVKPKMASKGDSNDEIKQQRIKGVCVFSLMVAQTTCMLVHMRCSPCFSFNMSRNSHKVSIPSLLPSSSVQLSRVVCVEQESIRQ